METILTGVVGSILPKENGYPDLLGRIFDPPSPLYYEGNLEILKKPLVSIVGTRRCTAYGENTAYKLAKELSARGIAIVSGLAFGIDAAAHRGALCGSGGTIAVLASGLPNVSPVSNAWLAEKILKEGGLVLSENCAPPLERGKRAQSGGLCGNDAHYKSDFLVRNRIIAGLSAVTVVVEAGERSGALNTADHAGRENRAVGAVPGRICDEQSAGTLKLILNGATMITEARDIADMLGVRWDTVSVDDLGLMGIEKAVYLLLSGGPKTANELCGELTAIAEGAATTAEVSGALVALEIAGLVRQGLGARYYLQDSRERTRK